MTLRIKLSHLVVGLIVGALLVGGGYALANTRNAVIHACINLRTRVVTVPARGRCTHGLRGLSWNRQGLRGVSGARGATGSPGTSAGVTIGSVTTLAAGSPATVTDSGTSSKAVLNFGIPQGAAGANAVGTGATAYGQVWMGSGTNSARLAAGSNSSNVEGVGGGNGTAVVGVIGCSAQGMAEPIITAVANHDPADNLVGSNTAGTAGVYVTGWSVTGDVLNFGVSTYVVGSGASADSDFSFVVFC